MASDSRKDEREDSIRRENGILIGHESEKRVIEKGDAPPGRMKSSGSCHEAASPNEYPSLYFLFLLLHAI